MKSILSIIIYGSVVYGSVAYSSLYLDPMLIIERATTTNSIVGCRIYLYSCKIRRMSISISILGTIDINIIDDGICYVAYKKHSIYIPRWIDYHIATTDDSRTVSKIDSPRGDMWSCKQDIECIAR